MDFVNLGLMENPVSRPWLKAISGLSINLSAAWFTAVFIAPNFWPLARAKDFLVLTADLILAIMSLLLTVKLEGLLEGK